MTDAARLAAFEQMLEAVKRDYAEYNLRLERLKAEGKTKTATFRQYMGNKLTCKYVLSLYEAHGLLDHPDKEGSKK